MKDGPSDRIRTCGILLPKQARYQLRYTRLLSCFIRLVVFSQTRRPTNWATPGNIIFVLSNIAPYRRFAALRGCKQNSVLQHPRNNWTTPG